MNKFEFRKWGNGSNCYSVSLLTDYDVVTKMERYTDLGMVQKCGNVWVNLNHNNNQPHLAGKTRKELTDKMAKWYRENNQGGK